MRRPSFSLLIATLLVALGLMTGWPWLVHVRAFAIARNGSPVTGTADSTTATFTFNYTCPAGSNQVLYVSAAWGQAGQAATTTYNSVSMTELWQFEDGASGNTTGAWILINPPTAVSHAVVISFTPDVDIVNGGAVCYSGVDQSTPNRTPVETQGAGLTGSVVVANAVAGDLVVDAITAFSGSVANDGGQTLIWEDDAIAGSGALSGGASEEAASGSTTTTWTFDGSSRPFGIGGAALIPAAAAGAGCAGRLLLLGAGCL